MWYSNWIISVFIYNEQLVKITRWEMFISQWTHSLYQTFKNVRLPRWGQKLLLHVLQLRLSPPSVQNKNYTSHTNVALFIKIFKDIIYITHFKLRCSVVFESIMTKRTVWNNLLHFWKRKKKLLTGKIEHNRRKLLKFNCLLKSPNWENIIDHMRTSYKSSREQSLACSI